MKLSFILVISLLFLSTFSFCQTPVLSEGSTVSMQLIPNPGQGATFDFELCCGEPQGKGGYLGNGFAYIDNNFTLYIKTTTMPIGYKVEGTIGQWFLPQPISPYCTVLSASLNEVTIYPTNGDIVTGLVGEYSQLFCGANGSYWAGPGGLTAHPAAKVLSKGLSHENIFTSFLHYVGLCCRAD